MNHQKKHQFTIYVGDDWLHLSRRLQAAWREEVEYPGSVSQNAWMNFLLQRGCLSLQRELGALQET